MRDIVRFVAIAMNAARSPARAIAGALLSLCARKFSGGSRLKRAAWLVCAAFAHRVRMIWIRWQSYSGVNGLTDDRPQRSSVLNQNFLLDNSRRYEMLRMSREWP